MTDEVSRLLAVAITPNSQKTYSSGWNAFCEFLVESFGVCTIPASALHIRQFVAWLSLRGLSPNSIATYVAGVGYHHKLMGYLDPTKDFVVSKLLTGCRRDRHAPDSRQPITVPVLRLILQAVPRVCSSQYEAVLFRSVFLCAFFGFMRVGEFTVTSKDTVQDSTLKISDVQFCRPGVDSLSEHVLISFRVSKTNQAGPPQVIRLVPSLEEFMCPVQGLREFLRVRPTGLGPLFCHFDSLPLTRFQFRAVLQRALTFSNLQHGHFTAHSFRIGAATVAHSLGVSQTDIRLMGRWRSDAVLSYIRPDVICAIPGVAE